MAQQQDAYEEKTQKKDDLSYIHEKMASLMKVSGWPTGYSIPMKLVDPLVKDYAHATETVDLMVGSCRKVLATSANPSLQYLVNNANVKEKVKDVQGEVLSGGECVFASDNSEQGVALFKALHDSPGQPQNKGDWQYNIDANAGGEVYQIMLTLLSEKYFEKFKSVYMVGYNTEENTYSATNIDAIKNVLVSAGNIVGNLQGGQTVNASQITNLVADALTNLGNTSEDHWSKDTGFTTFMATNGDLGDSGATPSVCGVKWRYQATVNNVSKCCTSTYNSWYKVESHCCIFYNWEAMQAIYKEVTGLGLK
mmetsp:Transcript_64997/g.103464  ORF Transcript_64997/g.103464 Transcript_64997/m.103464 type:complete len:309 (-) Transcript_64997:109-1035(-)|eukprot:CAMPEP_0197054572 /NCGR_PEP_ID=MMETSP1384-20130603/44295_1 /TAXON_ID=29189 /ORGANISM="Ammonia sp." /LENGTH=308 /DNA_ID=CAMNT_0042487795 /DNA_START=97 /DNA_END=1023 /DNA_ORIENTATION=+